jgi:hypothetical protein
MTLFFSPEFRRFNTTAPHHKSESGYSEKSLDEYLSNGGKIETCPIGASTYAKGVTHSQRMNQEKTMRGAKAAAKSCRAM